MKYQIVSKLDIINLGSKEGWKRRGRLLPPQRLRLFDGESFGAPFFAVLLPDTEEGKSEIGIKHVSRKANRGFNLIPCNLMDDHQLEGNTPNRSSFVSSREACLCYTLPIPNFPKLFLFQRVGNNAVLNDFEICNRYDIDNTGIVFGALTFYLIGLNNMIPSKKPGLEFKYPNCVGPWPSEEVLAFYCLSHADLFRSKKVIELGSGYGLAGLVIAMATEALEVVISDGNPQVVDYIQRNINANYGAFGAKEVKSLMLHWKQQGISDISNTFDVIVASDCTFFKEFHKGLVQTLKCLLKKEGPSTALFFSPKRGDSLDEFLMEVKESGLHFSVDEIYDTEVWRRHQGFIDGDDSWPNYDEGHCYPLLVRVAW